MTLIIYTTRRSETAFLSEAAAKTVADAINAKRHTNVEAVPSAFGKWWIVQQTTSNGTPQTVTHEYAHAVLDSRVD